MAELPGPAVAAPAKMFHIGDLLSVTDGRLVSPNHIGGVYEVVDFVTGEKHMTHQLPRACDAVRPWLLEQHPWLSDVVFDFEIPDGTPRDDAMMIVMAWLSGVAAEHGEQHEVRAMPFGMYMGREPIAEMRELAPHAEVISIDMDDRR